MPLPLLAGPIAGKLLGFLTNKWVIIAIIIASMSAGIWWYKNKSEKLQLEYDAIKVQHDLRVSEVKTLKEIRVKLNEDYQEQLNIVDRLNEEKINQRQKYDEVMREIARLETMLDNIPGEIAKNPERKAEILQAATEKFNAKLLRSIMCLELATENEVCDEP